MVHERWCKAERGPIRAIPTWKTLIKAAKREGTVREEDRKR